MLLKEKNKIIKFIHQSLLTGPKSGPELVSDVVQFCYMEHIPIGNLAVGGISHLIDEFVTEGKLIEVCHVNPGMDYRIKSIYFHPKAKVTLRN